MIANARLLMEEAERARQGENPGEVEVRYRKAVDTLTQARNRWPGNQVILELLARNRQALGQECERKGSIEVAEKEYNAAIDLWNELCRLDKKNDDYQRGLALGYGCRGDVKLLDDGTGWLNEREAVKDYDESLKLRKELVERSPENGDYQIQYIIAKTNYARLYFQRQRDVSSQRWKEVVELLKTTRSSLTFDEKTKREAGGLLAISLLDHQNGYLACFDSSTLKPGPPESPERTAARDSLQLAETLCQEMRNVGDPDAVVREIALSYFKIRLRFDEQANSFPTLLERLQTHIDTLPKGERNWARSLFVEIVLEMRRTQAAEADQWEARADAFANQLPKQHYFYSMQFDRWKKRASQPKSK